MDLETNYSNDSDYDDFANEIPFVGDIMQPFQFEPVFSAPTSHILMRTQLTRWRSCQVLKDGCCY